MAGELTAIIAKIRRTATLARDAAPDVADILRGFVGESIAAGRTPGGEALAPRKADGGQPLRNAAKAITVKAVGSIVTATVMGFPELLHNRGTKRMPARRLIPESGVIPEAIAEEIRRALARRFEELTR